RENRPTQGPRPKAGARPLTAAIIGVGSMGRHHLRVYEERDDCDLIAFADTNAKTLSAYKKKYRAEAFIDYHDLFALKPDLVSIAVPTRLHKQVALAALRAGCHVLVEKPIASTVADAEEMMRAAERAGRILLVGHIERFNPVVQRLKETINSRKIGVPISISAARVSPYPIRIQDVGIFLDFAIHDIDVISYLYGERAQTVYAIAGATNGVSHDHADIMMKFSENRAGIIEISWRAPMKFRKILVVGTEGFALGDFIEQSLFYLDEGWSREQAVETGEPLALEIEHFIRCARGLESPLVTPEQSIYSLRVALLAEESAHSGKVLPIGKK
ncbi:MAG: Gfo/Idh/MocA family oxidoreductase, partial [bacterium]